MDSIYGAQQPEALGIKDGAVLRQFNTCMCHLRPIFWDIFKGFAAVWLRNGVGPIEHPTGGNGLSGFAPVEIGSNKMLASRYSPASLLLAYLLFDLQVVRS